MANGDRGSVTNRDLYDAINGLRVEVTGQVQRLDDKFSQLEAGRLTRAEQAIGSLQVRDATLSTKVYVLVFIISSVVSAIITAVALKFIR